MFLISGSWGNIECRPLVQNTVAPEENQLVSANTKSQFHLSWNPNCSLSLRRMSQLYLGLSGETEGLSTILCSAGHPC